MFRRRMIRRRRPIIRRRRLIRRRAPRRYTNNGVRFFKVTAVINQPTAQSQVNITDSPIQTTFLGWDAIANLFGWYRTAGIKLSYVPTYSVNQQGTANQMTPIYAVHDWLLSPNTLTLNQVLAHETLKTFHSPRGFKKFWKCRRQMYAPGAGGVMSNGWTPTSDPVATQRILLWNESNVANTEPKAKIVVTLYIAAKQRN